MSAYNGCRRNLNGYDYKYQDHRHRYDDDLDTNLYAGRRTRSSSSSRRWHQRRSFDDTDIEDCLLDSRDTKMSTLQHHLAELKEDNRQMSLRLSKAEGCLQDFNDEDYDDGILTRHQTTMIDDFDRPLTRRRSFTENDRHRRLRRDLREIREDLSAMRHSIDQPSVEDDLYLSDGRRLSPASRRRRLRHLNDSSYLDENDLGEWGARQLEGVTWTKQRSVLDGYYSRRSPVPSISPTRSSNYAGYRSVFPRPISTQHNRRLQHSLLTSQRYDPNYGDDDGVFVPSSPAELSIGDRVKVSRRGGTSTGRVKYIGHLPGKVGPYVGLELENEGGKHDGIYDGFRYFQCKGYRGIFLPFDRVVLAWRQ